MYLNEYFDSEEIPQNKKNTYLKCLCFISQVGANCTIQ